MGSEFGGSRLERWFEQQTGRKPITREEVRSLWVRKYKELNPHIADRYQRTMDYAHRQGGLTLRLLKLTDPEAWGYTTRPQTLAECAIELDVPEASLQALQFQFFHAVIQPWLAAWPEATRQDLRFPETA